MNRIFSVLFTTGLTLAFISCGTDKDALPQIPKAIDTTQKKPITGRWYTEEQKTLGLTVFAKHYAVCHGDKAQETVDWKTLTASGHCPPPPLNGKAHAWHHPLPVLQIVFVRVANL